MDSRAFITRWKSSIHFKFFPDVTLQEEKKSPPDLELISEYIDKDCKCKGDVRAV